MEGQMDRNDTTEMADESRSPDESNIDSFVEQERDMIASNDFPYDSASFLEFEKRLQKCVANHFLDSSANEDSDSLASECSFSGYVNEECESTKQKFASLTKRDIMSNKAHHRMKGVIARKKTTQRNDADMDTSASTETDDNPFELDTAISNGAFPDFRESARNRGMKTIPKYRTRKGHNSTNALVKHDSDSSDSILDTIIHRQTRKRRYRKKSKKKTSIKSSGISKKREVATDGKVSAITSDPRSREMASHVPSSHDSVVSGRCSSDVTPETKILPSLVKKGIKYYDVPKIERALVKMLRKSHTMSRKQKVLDQLLERFTLQIDDTGSKQKGMELVHKLKAERKMALQAAFLRYSRESQSDSDERSKLSFPAGVKDENSKVLGPASFEDAVIVPKIEQHNHMLSPLSLSSVSSIEERNRFKLFVDQTKRTLSYSFGRNEEEGLLVKHIDDQLLTSSSYSSPDEIVLMPKMSSFEKIKFSRSQKNVYFESQSPPSSLSKDSWNDSGDLSVNNRSTDFSIRDENQLHPSDFSEWSEMSFRSEPNRFDQSPILGTKEKVRKIFACFKKQTDSREEEQLPQIQCQVFKTVNDPFDEIVLRKKPSLIDKSFSNHVGDESPTGVMNFFPEAQPQQNQKEANDVLAFVGDDEADYLFADEEDSFVMKSTEQIFCEPTICQPVFLSPSRFEI